MALSTLPGDEKQEDKLNPGQQDYDRRFNDIVSAEQKGTFDDIANNYDQTADGSQEDRNINKLREKESQGDGVAASPIKSTYSGGKSKIKGKAWFKRVGPLAGIGGGFGILGLIFAALSGTTLLLPNLNNNAFAKNDARGTMLERRILAAFDQKMADKSGPCDTIKAACRMKKMPMSMLSAMEKQGIVAVNTDGSKYPIEGNGYAGTNPDGYEITQNGTKKIVPASEFKSEYKNNPVFRKAFKGAYNMRFLGYNGKYMFENFFKKYGLKRDGGLAADSSLNESNANDKLDEKLKPATEGEGESGAKQTFRDRIDSLLTKSAEKVKKTGGDPILFVGTAFCTTVNLPRFVAGTYRAIQVAQILVLVNDLVLSPGGMQQAGDAKAEKISAIGALLTARVAKSGSNVKKAATDSAVLQSAIGVNKNKVTLGKYTPGRNLLTNPTVQKSNEISAATKEPCNIVNSPHAAFAAIAIESAISIGTAGVGAAVIAALKGSAKLAVAIGAVDIALQAAQESGLINLVADTAYGMVANGIGNYVEGAKGEDLGDALGMGIFAYFSLAGSAGGGAVLTKSQVNGFSEAMASTENEFRDEDIATLSPLDTSSQYTFLGSIMSNLALHTTTDSDNPLSKGASILSYMFQAPFASLTSSASAATGTADTVCDNADQLGLDDDIAVNPAGYGCIGLPPTAMNMSRDTAMSLVADDLDPDTGEPKDDSDINLVKADCAEGDLESMSGCTIGESGSQEDLKRAAQSVYPIDLQVENILSGNDEETQGTDAANTGSTATTGRPDGAIDAKNGWTFANNTDYSSTPCDPRTPDKGIFKNPTYGFTVRLCEVNFNTTDAYSADGGNTIASVVSTNAINMFEAARAAGIEIGLTDGMRRTGAAGYSQHKYGLAMDLANPSTGNTICYAGVPSSVTGWGSSEGAEAACSRIGGTQYAAYKWLQANGAKYGFYNLETEPWHWSTSGQ